MEVVMENTKSIIVRQIGQVQLSVSQFTEEQRVIFEKVLNIVDRNPSIDWNNDKDNHNRDFCLAENNIEPVKEFCLKVQFIGALSMQAARMTAINRERCLLSVAGAWVGSLMGGVKGAGIGEGIGAAGGAAWWLVEKPP